MKRAFSLIAAFVLAASLTACANTATAPEGYGADNNRPYRGNVSTTTNGRVNGTNSNTNSKANTKTSRTNRTTGSGRTNSSAGTNANTNANANSNAMGAGM